MPENAIKTVTASRRTFLEWIMSGLLFGVFLSAANIIVRYLLPQPKAEKVRELSLPVGQIPPGSSVVVDYRATPVIVVNSRSGISAFQSACTHLGCLVKWMPERQKFLCPCHAGVFDADGKVVSGPPPEPLRRVNIEIVGDRVVFP
jgi:cytochrome b6-f complex iron-sulfur subunit